MEAYLISIGFAALGLAALIRALGTAVGTVIEKHKAGTALVIRAEKALPEITVKVMPRIDFRPE